MSVLRKIPTIERVLDSKTVAELKSLEKILNDSSVAPKTYSLWAEETLLKYENVDNGMWLVNLELEKGKEIRSGFLIWEDNVKALFICYDISQNIVLFEIDTSTYTYTKIKEECSVEELRRVLEDNINKEVVHIDTSGNVEVGKNLIVDGKIIVNSGEDLVDTSGNELKFKASNLLNDDGTKWNAVKINTYSINIDKTEISTTDSTNTLFFNESAITKTTTLFNLLAQNENNIFNIKVKLNLVDGTSFLIFMNYHKASVINNENIQGITVSSTNTVETHYFAVNGYGSNLDLQTYYNYLSSVDVVVNYY